MEDIKENVIILAQLGAHQWQSAGHVRYRDLQEDNKTHLNNQINGRNNCHLNNMVDSVAGVVESASLTFCLVKVSIPDTRT